MVIEIIEHYAPVAQLDRVPGYELGGRTFESCRVRHTKKPAFAGFFACLPSRFHVLVRKERSSAERAWRESEGPKDLAKLKFESIVPKIDSHKKKRNRLCAHLSRSLSGVPT